MKPLCYSRPLFTFVIVALLSLSTVNAAQKKSAIVYYGKDISYSNVGIHDYIIVEADNISPYTHGFKTYKKKIYAYVSIGEANTYRSYFNGLKQEWKLTENKTWKSTVMDVSNDEYHEFIYDEVIQPLVDKGYGNFFFDTLDSYALAAKTEEDRTEYRLGLIRFIKKFKVRYPDSKLILNRGFEIIDEVHENIDAVLFESLFYGLSSPSLAYAEVRKEDRIWLLSQLKKVKNYKIDIIALDYVAIQEKLKIEKNIKNIEAEGFIPYISNKELTRYGASSKTAFKREVLVLYNTDVGKELSNAHRMASLPIEYLGYVPIVKNIKDGLPNRDELSRYQAVVIWLEQPVKREQAYINWIKILREEKIKVLFIDGFALEDDQSLCEGLGIKKLTNKADVFDKQTVLYKDEIFGFETPLAINYVPILYQTEEGKALLHLRNTASQESMPAAVMPWGGYALSGMMSTSFADNTLWVMNPFIFFQEALALKNIPVPDPTTENGRRLLFAHIDGDASMNKVEWDPRKYSIGVMYEKVLKKYKIPQSVSIVQAETDPKGLYPKDSPALEEEARKIYRLPYVEGATHTLTHPFKWGEIKDGDLNETYRLKLKDYAFSIDTEIRGSLKYINTRLLPKEKPRANTVFWTGDCLPKEEVLEYTYKHQILNINGGDTIITNDKPWLSLVAPYGLKRGEYRQVYTGAENENVYTNDWRGPFWGFKKVIQTFELTDKPRRLKPIDIYYHFYAASKDASLKALDDVYTWALKQETMPIYTSEYIPKVLEFYDLSMVKSSDGWSFEGMNALKTLRLSSSMPKVDFKASSAVLGEKVEESVRYVHLNTQADSIDLYLDDLADSDENYLIDSNAEVLRYVKSEKQVLFRLKSYVNISMNYHLKKGCILKTKPKARSSKHKGNKVALKFKVKEADVIIQCQ